jgi:hypothetical protein
MKIDGWPRMRSRRSFSSNSHRIVILRGCDFIDFHVKSSRLKRSEVDLLCLFCPSDLTAPNKSHHPPLVIPTRNSCHVALDRAACAPFRKERRMKHISSTNLNRNPGERTRISYFTALPAVTDAALRKESRMKFTEATVFDRKSGGAEGPAVRPGSRTKVPAPLVLPQNRHPVRRFAQDDDSVGV